MRILLVQNTDFINRNPAQQHHLVELLSLRRHNIRVIDYDILWKERKKEELISERMVVENFSKIHKDANVTVIRPPIIKIPIIDYFSLMYTQKKEIERQIKVFKPDIIYSMGIVGYLAGGSAKKHNIPFIYYWIDVTHRLIPFKFLQPMGWMIEKLTLKKADKVLTINKKLKEYVINLGSIPEKTEVLDAGIYLERFDPQLDGEEIRKEHGISEDELVLFFMGWLYDFSGLKEVAREFARIKDVNSRLKMLIVGDGDAYGDLKKIKDEYSLDNLILTGKQPYEKIPQFISSADICILPAYPDEKIMQDIVPIKMYEYMAMKKPVIVTKLPGVMKEFGEDNGVVYVDKPEDVVAKVMELVQNGSVEELGLKARRFVERNSWDKITDEFEKILDKVIKEKHG